MSGDHNEGVHLFPFRTQKLSPLRIIHWKYYGILRQVLIYGKEATGTIRKFQHIHAEG